MAALLGHHTEDTRLACCHLGIKVTCHLRDSVFGTLHGVEAGLALTRGLAHLAFCALVALSSPASLFVTIFFFLWRRLFFFHFVGLIHEADKAVLACPVIEVEAQGPLCGGQDESGEQPRREREAVTVAKEALVDILTTGEDCARLDAIDEEGDVAVDDLASGVRGKREAVRAALSHGTALAYELFQTVGRTTHGD